MSRLDEQQFQREQTGLANEEALRRFEREAGLQRELTGVKEAGRAQRAATQQANIDRRAREANQAKIRAAQVGAGMSPFEEQTEKEEAKRVSKLRGDFQSRGSAARQTLNQLARADFLIDAAGDTGAGANAIAAVKSFGQTLGIPADVIDEAIPVGPNTNAAEALRALNTELGLSRVGQTKGQISNYEMQLFLQSVPGIQNPQQANRMIVEFMRAQAQREQDVARLAARHRGRFGEDWLDQVESLGPVMDRQMEARLLGILNKSREQFESEVGDTSPIGGATPQIIPEAQAAGEPQQIFPRRRVAAGQIEGIDPGVYELRNGQFVRVGD